MQLLTIGHSNRSAEDFLSLLQQYGVAQLLDVRRMPRSRFNPHFNGKALQALLAKHEIAYHHLPELGGMRTARPDTINTGLRAGGGFQGYADYMRTDAFASALQQLLQLAASQTTAYMCAEREPSQCHRSLISDALLARGHAVTHLVRADESYPHLLTKGAAIVHGLPTYPAGPPKQMALL